MKVECKKLHNQMNISEAQESCSTQFRGFLPETFPNMIEYDLIDRMKKYDIKMIWLGIKKKIYENPFWIDSTPVGKA